MKDLFKGHHPWLLVLVIAVDIFSALTIRHSILSKGESEFNANVFFLIVIVAGLALYALLVEFLSGKDMPLIGETEEKEAKIVQQIPVSQPVIDINSSTPQSKERPLSRGDFEDMMLNVVTKLRQETAIPPEASLKKHDETGVVSFNINDMKESAASLVQSQEDAKYRFACEYTAEKLGPYVKPCDLEKLFFRLGLFQRASSPNWDSRTPEEIEANIPAARIEVASPIEKWALLHFGWNMGRLFGKPNNFINHFLKTTFHYHLDGLSDNQLPKKLKQNPLQGVIKIEERFDKGLTIADYNIEEDTTTSANTGASSIEPATEKVVKETIPKTAAPISYKPDPPISTEEKSKIAESEEAQEPADEERDDYDDLNDYDEDRDMDNDNDEPMNDEEWAEFVQRSMERGKDSRSLDCGDLIAG